MQRSVLLTLSDDLDPHLAVAVHDTGSIAEHRLGFLIHHRLYASRGVKDLPKP
jgi:hypothetical protein